MSGHERFLQAIWDEPWKDTPRWICADWLEENGGPDRAEFIRLQVKLGYYLGSGGIPANAQSKSARIEELLELHSAEWLGPRSDLQDELWFRPVFHRGFLEQLHPLAQLVLSYQEVIQVGAPSFNWLTLLGVPGTGQELAECPLLRGVVDLQLANWITAEDTKTLVASPYLEALATLVVWIGHSEDQAVCQTPVSRPASFLIELV